MSTARRGGTTSSSPVTARTRTASTSRGGLPVTPSGLRTRTVSSTSRHGTATLAQSGRTPGPATRTKSPARPPLPTPEPQTPLSIREAIALKRAEARKAPQGSKELKHAKSLGNISARNSVNEDIELSRWSIKDSIERARSSGNLNLSSRSLASIPTALYEIHLGVTPEPLKIAPKETEDELHTGKSKERAQTAWFEAADLTALRLRDNVIVEIQPEISLFGSLKTLDLRNNRLTTLPDSLADLLNLITLDLSSNQLTSLPPDIATLPFLTILNVSSNQLTALPLDVPKTSRFSQNSSASFFALPVVARASKPLPSLRQLFASGNKIEASSTAADFPPDLGKCDLGNNPLGNAQSLMRVLSQLRKLKELSLEAAEISDESFISVKGFAALDVLDLSKTRVTEKVAEVFQDRAVFWEGEDVQGGVRVTLGTRIQKEAWEIEADRRALGRLNVPSVQVRMTPSASMSSSTSGRAEEPLKERWEIEAEQGLLTEGGRRRAKAAAAAAASGPKTSCSPSMSSSNPPLMPALIHYYDATHLTLTLPRSLPRTHSRARSLASMVSDVSDPMVPAATLPLPVILGQSFAQTLNSLILTNRRLDPSFIVPGFFSDSTPLLPALRELHLDGCSLTDSVSIIQDDVPGSPRKEPIFSIIATLFPALTLLDVSDNTLTCMAGIRTLLIPDSARRTKGLKTLKLRGNKIVDLAGLEAVSQVLKSEGAVEGWRLEELDLRDNEIAKLPPMLGYLPLDVLLVEGNTFRVPARRIWEREGTKGLLAWLKDRVE